MSIFSRLDVTFRGLSSIARNFLFGISFFTIVAMSQQAAQASVVTLIGGGDNHTCAALAEGGLKCWGSGSFGQIGDGAKLSRSTPVAVPALAGFKIMAVAGGTYFSCALTSTGAIYCWGHNAYGQLGNGTYVDSATPVAVHLPTGPAVGLIAGRQFACLLDTFGNVYCWGQNNFGQLNRSVKAIGGSNVPIYSAGENNIVALAGNGMGTCFLDKTGGDKCFGVNQQGQKGIGVKDATAGATYGTPSYVTGLSTGVVSISASMYDGCAVTTLHALYCWGENTAFGQFGFSGTGYYLTPLAISGTRSDVKAVYARDYHTCITTVGGAAQCWGNNTYGQVGRGTPSNNATPGDVLTLSEGVISLSLGYGHSCALLKGGTVKCWGLNNLSQLGNGSTTNSILPLAVPL